MFAPAGIGMIAVMDELQTVKYVVLSLSALLTILPPHVAPAQAVRQWARISHAQTIWHRDGCQAT